MGTLGPTLPAGLTMQWLWAPTRDLRVKITPAGMGAHVWHTSDALFVSADRAGGAGTADKGMC